LKIYLMMKPINTKNSKKQDLNTTDKTIRGFIFYLSYFEAIETLSKKNRLIAYETIVKYALYGKEPINLPKVVLSIFTIAKPNIDANYRKYLKKGKSKSQTIDSSEEELIEKVPLPKKKCKSNSVDEFPEPNNEFID